MNKVDMPIILKRCTPDDLDNLVWISRITYFETFIVCNTVENMEIYLETNMSREGLFAEIVNIDSIFYLAYVDEELIGYLKVNTGLTQTEIFEYRAIELERIYILKKFHGRNYGDQLLQKAIDHGKEINAEFIWLGVWESNFRAIRFYEKKGFEQFGKHDFVMGNEVQVDQLMKLEIH